MKEVLTVLFGTVVIVLAWFMFTASAVSAQEVKPQNAGEEEETRLKCTEGGHGPFGWGLFKQIIDRLDLTEVQQSEIESILTEECTGTVPLVGRLEENRRELQAATKNGAFNEEEVRTIAGRHAEMVTELMVAKERTKSRVYEVLTEEQRVKAEEMLELLKPGHKRLAH